MSVSGWHSRRWAGCGGLAVIGSGSVSAVQGIEAFGTSIARHADALLDEGRRTFRHDTFGDEEFWGGRLRLHEAIAGEKLGGVGPGVSPATALAVGLKVDVDALPASLVGALEKGKVDLQDPATTLGLLQARLRRRRPRLLRQGRTDRFDGDPVRPLPLDGRRLASRPASATGSTAGRTAT